MVDIEIFKRIYNARWGFSFPNIGMLNTMEQRARVCSIWALWVSLSHHQDKTDKYLGPPGPYAWTQGAVPDKSLQDVIKGNGWMLI